MDIKEIQIRRKEDKSHLPTAVIDAARKKISSIFDGRQPLRALKPEEERELLPRLIGVDSDSRDWERKIREFWAEFTIDVPSGGVVLNITIDSDRTTAAFPKGMPVNIEDYIAFRFAKVHRYVAESEKEMRANPTQGFYIFDPEKEDRAVNTIVKQRKQASGEFWKLTKDVESDEEAASKMRRVFRILTGVNPSRMTNIQIENRLDTYVQNNPKRFYEVVTDRNLDTRALIDEMIETSVLRRQGNHILYADDVIGHTTEEAILFFQDKKNSQTITMLEANLDTARSAQVN